MPEGLNAVEFSSPIRTRLIHAARRVGLLAIAAALVGMTVGAVAAPEPEAVPRRWQMDVKVGPMRITHANVRDQGLRPFYTMTYTVTNNWGEDLLFAPAFELGTDAGEIMRSGRGVPVEVTREIIDGLQNPYVEDQIAIIGPILQGRENAKDGVVIWPVGTMSPTEIIVYAAGFSGETATVEVDDPAKPGEKKKVVLRKTLMVRYQVPGTLEGIGSRPLEVLEQRWIMR